jgi:hypothetical protein
MAAMMGHKEKLVSGDEQDALSVRSKRFLAWAAGVRKAMKAKFNRRARKQARLESDQNAR